MNPVKSLASRLLVRSLPYPMDSLKKPIPLRQEEAATALGYHAQPVDTTLSLSKEPLVQAETFGLSSESFYARTDGANAPYNRCIPGALPQVWMRESVAQRLSQVNELLSSRGLEVHIMDAYRPIETQQALWNHFIEIGRLLLGTNEHSKLRQFAGQFASEPTGFDPQNPLTWPTHNTGGAVDVTLRDKTTDKLLDMGSGFDQSSPRSFTDAIEQDLKSQDKRSASTNSTNKSGPYNKSALHNRRILYNAMLKMGFANYPYEWWHYDYGTQMWLQNGAGHSGCKTAWYGPAAII